jgi:hypothetical protein
MQRPITLICHATRRLVLERRRLLFKPARNNAPAPARRARLGRHLLLFMAFDQQRAFVRLMSDRNSQLITIFMLIGALAMVGLALSGTLQMSRLPVAHVATK